MHYSFEWDPEKAKLNKKKHNVDFELSTTVFYDPQMLSIFDEKHSDSEERWITLGITSTGLLLVVNHTFVQIGINKVKIRVISSRKATRNEINQYKGV